MTGRSLSAEERVHARRALLFLAERSAPARLAEALGLTVVALQKARAPTRVVGRRLAARVASVAGVDLADVLSGAWPGGRRQLDSPISDIYISPSTSVR